MSPPWSFQNLAPLYELHVNIDVFVQECYIGKVRVYVYVTVNDVNWTYANISNIKFCANDTYENWRVQYNLHVCPSSALFRIVHGDQTKVLHLIIPHISLDKWLSEWYSIHWLTIYYYIFILSKYRMLTYLYFSCNVYNISKMSLADVTNLFSL